MVHDLKNVRQQLRLREFLAGRSFPYFLLGMSKHLTYPENYHPISSPLYHHSACDVRPSINDYLKRPLDLFLSWGNNHPWRPGITEALRGEPYRREVILGEDGRLPQPEYFSRLSSAFASASFDGYGPFSFRTTEVLVRTLLLMGPEQVVTHAPLIDGVHCVRYEVLHHGEHFAGTNVAHKLRLVLDDPEAAFEIYQAGYDHCQTHLTETATAQYLLDVLNAHDWSKPTQLEIA